MSIPVTIPPSRPTTDSTRTSSRPPRAKPARAASAAALMMDNSQSSSSTKPLPIPIARTSSLAGRKRGSEALASSPNPSGILSTSKAKEQERVRRRRTKSFGDNVSIASSSSSSSSSPTGSRKKSPGASTVKELDEDGVSTEADLTADEKTTTSRSSSTSGSQRTARSKRGTTKDDGYKRAMLKTFVRSALRGVEIGDSGPYQELVSSFLPTPTSPSVDLTAVTPLLSALTSSMSLVTKISHASLIRAILALPWAASSDESFVKAYLSWARVLCTAKTEWVGDVVVMIVKGLAFERRPRRPISDSAATQQLTRRQYYARYHTLLRALLELIPTLPSVLGPALVKFLPHKRETRIALEVYARNALDVVEFCPEVAGKVWEAVIQRLLSIDLEIQIEMDDVDDEMELGMSLEESERESMVRRGAKVDPMETLVTDDIVEDDSDDDDDSEDGLGHLDLEDLSSDEESVDGDARKSIAEDDEEKLKRLEQLRDKVDALSLHLFHHLKRIFGDLASSPVVHPSYTQPEARLAHFQTLLSIFEKLILSTFQSRRTQFIVFWLCSLDAQYTELFLGLLVSRALFEQSPASVTRIAAASYISSFVSRAKYIDDQQTRAVVKYLLAFIDGFLAEAREDVQAVAASGGLAVFYSVCQAVMMIFCFRWQALEDGSHDLLEESLADDMEMEHVNTTTDGVPSKWLGDLDILERAVMSQLNPLMACYPEVVSMFAKIAHSTKFMFCYSKITANRTTMDSLQGSRPSLGGSRKGNAALENVLPLIGKQTLQELSLDAFFPFDPYDLPRSRLFVDELYRHWHEVAQPGEVDGDDDETEDEEEYVNGDHKRLNGEDSSVTTGSLKSASASHPGANSATSQSTDYISMIGRSLRMSGAHRDFPTDQLSSSLGKMQMSVDA